MTSVLQYRDPMSGRSGFPMSATTFAHSAPSMSTTIKRSPPYEGQSSGSDTRKQQTPGAKRRPSRAGTRSVSTLTAAQLERKRANDREAQRAIRQRTKDHIEGLERQIAELTAQLNPNSPIIMDLRRRNEELERENAILRSRLSQALTTLGVSDTSSGNVIAGTDTGAMLPATAGTSSPNARIPVLNESRRVSPGTTRSVHEAPEAKAPVSQAGHWQSQQPPYPTNTSSPHLEAAPPMNEVYPAHTQHPVSMTVQDPSLHTMDAGSHYQYPMEAHPGRSISYPMEPCQAMTTQPMQQAMTEYATPTSNQSPQAQEYQRQMTVPVNGPATHHSAHMQQQQQPPPPPYPNFQNQNQQQGFMAQASHPGDMQMMQQAPQSHPSMMGEQPHMMYQMKVEQHH